MKKDKKAKSWFVIIIGEKERHRPFEITRRALVLLSICLLLLIGAIAAGSSWLYSRAYVNSNNELTGELAAARQSIEQISQEKAGFLEEIEKLREETKTLRAKGASLAAAVKQKEASAAAEAKKAQAVAAKPFVSIEEMQIAYNADHKTLKVRFIIRNQSTGEDLSSGYVFIILNPAPDSSAPRRVYPWVELVNGLPRSHKRGENFSIARFKYIEGVFSSVSDRNMYTSVTILGYEDDGTLRLKQEVPL
jgi:hypothetical protein